MFMCFFPVPPGGAVFTAVSLSTDAVLSVGGTANASDFKSL
jgi:hypothetical protein